MSDQTVDAYERLLIQPTRGFQVFLFAAHYTDANFVQVGFGMESASKLQRSHVGGPQVHELHVSLLTDWMRRGGRLVLTEDPTLTKHHPFSSTMTTDLPVLLTRVLDMPLGVGRFAPLVEDPEISDEITTRFADVIDRVRIKAFGHPLTWDVRHSELKDGRFVWMAYDDDLRKIRVGMGFHNEDNEKQYGVHTYALSKKEAAEFAAFQFYYVDAPLQFMGLPPRWPMALEFMLYGKQKQQFVRDFLALADEVWPGEVSG